MLGITLRGRMQNKELRQRAGSTNIITRMVWDQLVNYWKGDKKLTNSTVDDQEVGWTDDIKRLYTTGYRPLGIEMNGKERGDLCPVVD